MALDDIFDEYAPPEKPAKAPRRPARAVTALSVAPRPVAPVVPLAKRPEALALSAKLAEALAPGPMPHEEARPAVARSAHVDNAEITLVDYRNRDAWLAARNSAIGASEAAALFGVSPWDTMLSLWAKKTGKVPPEEPKNAEWLDWGTLLEAPIAQRYAQLTGRTIWQGGPYCVAQHPRIEIMRATPDRWVIEAPDRGAPGLLQIKNTSAYKDADWTDEPPRFVQIQVQHEMAVTGRQWASVAVLIGGNRFRYFDVERNDEFIAELEAQCRWFWRFVETGEQPPQIEEADLTTLKRLHPDDDGTEVALPDEAIGWWQQIEEARRAESDAKKAKEKAETLLRAALGASTYGVLPTGERLSLKTTERGGYAVEPTKYRTLRLEKKGPRR